VRSLRVDLTALEQLDTAFEVTADTVIVHTAAISSVAVVDQDPARAHRVNVDATARLARRAADAGARFVYTSTDMVFDGESAPYDETSVPQPTSAYGRSKLDGESAAAHFGQATIVRLSLLYGEARVPRDTTFVAQARALLTGAALRLFHDEYRTPLCLEDAARGIIRLVGAKEHGGVHLGGPERLSRLEMGRELSRALGIEHPNIEPVSRLEFPSKDPRPRDLSLDSTAYRHRTGAEPARSMRAALSGWSLRV
jgi:dTDP-4-dehydrorhamnose reductase